MKIKYRLALVAVSTWLVPIALAQAPPPPCTRVIPAAEFPLPVIPDLYEQASVLSGFKDLDGDGTTERFYVTYSTPNEIHALRPRSNGSPRYEHVLTLVSRYTNQIPRRLRSISTADTNGDGATEIVAAWSYDNPYSTSNFWVDVYHPDGAGGYRIAEPLTRNGPYVIGPMLGDFDGDGRDDIALMIGELSGSATLLSVFSNDPEIGWSQRSERSIPATFSGLVLDYDNDGDDDLATLDIWLNYGVRIHTGDPYAPLTRSGVAYLPFNPRGMLITDFDGDGWKSMTMLSSENVPGTNDYFYRLHEMRPVPFGLAEVWSYDLPLGARYPYGVWDYNADGQDDLIYGFGDYYRNSRFLLLQGSVAGLTERARNLFDLTLFHAGDFDGDAWPDVLVGGSGGLTVLHGTPDGSVEPSWIGSLRRPNDYREFTSGDLDADGIADAVLRSYNGSLESWRGNGDGTFAMWQQGPSESSNVTHSLRDIDRDGAIDSAVTFRSPREGFAASVAFGRGDGGFDLPVRWFPSASPAYYSSTWWGDLDADGDEDAVVQVYGQQTSWKHELSYWLIEGRTATHAFQQFDAPLSSPRELADIDGDGRADLIGFVSRDNQTVMPVWARTGDGATPSLPVPMSIDVGTPWPWERLLSADLNGDRRADLLVSAGPSSLPRWQSFTGDGNGAFTKFWESDTTGYAYDGLVDDLDGDGLIDLLQLGGGIEVYRGDGAGGFLPRTRFIGLSGWSAIGRTRAGGALDVIGNDFHSIWGGLVASQQRGQIAERDEEPPAGQLVARAVVVRRPGVLPTFEGEWILGTSALDDCRGATLTARRLDLLATGSAAPITYYPAPAEEIRIYELPANGAREVKLFGPNPRAIRERFERARAAGGFELQQNARLRIVTADQFGPGAGQEGEPPPTLPNVRLTQRLIFSGDLPVHAEIRRPGGDVTVTLQAIDEAGKTATTVRSFSEAKRVYCDAPGAEQVACD